MMPDSASTRQVPKRSAMAPKKGRPAPQKKFCSAMARPKSVRSQPFSASMGSWKKPIAERGPKVSAAIRQPQTMISHGRLLDWGRAEAATLAICALSCLAGDTLTADVSTVKMNCLDATNQFH